MYHSIHSTCAGIVVPPESVNATLGSIAIFYCDLIGKVALWRINGSQFESLDPSRGIDPVVPRPDPVTGIRNLTLKVPAITVNNETMVQCIGVTDDEAVSPTASLLIQGVACSFLCIH